jgi:hypothetical protein
MGIANAAPSAPMPKMLAYSAAPNAYFNDFAPEVAKIYDGFFFVAGSWDETAPAQLGLDGGAETPWKTMLRQNIAKLNAAGVTENLLDVYFSESGTWPSPDTLLKPDYRDLMAKRFGAIAKEAHALGFRGLCVDVEYPYKRYSLDNPIYTYEGYTAEDLVRAAHEQGRAITNAMLDAFPEAVIMVLPGSLWCRALAREIQLAMLEVMAERDAPGGLHLGLERSYGLQDPVSQVAIPREGDCEVRALVHDAKMLDYWKRRCTVAPGVWPLHMLETGGGDYPVRPWTEEMAELRQQMEILRGIAKRYVWSYSGHAVWHPYEPGVLQQYGLDAASFDGARDVVAEWHRILADKTVTTDANLVPLIKAVHAFDRNWGDTPNLCARLGTPADWLLLGPLANPFTKPAYSAPNAWRGPLRLDTPVPGRDGSVFWRVFHNYSPIGTVRLGAAFDWFKTDEASAQLVTDIAAPARTDAVLNMGWDDGAIVYLNGEIVFDRRAYPESGHGMLFKDRNNFEETVPITLPAGRSRLAVVSINLRGVWGVNVRITDACGWPIEGIRFELPKE